MKMLCEDTIFSLTLVWVTFIWHRTDPAGQYSHIGSQIVSTDLRPYIRHCPSSVTMLILLSNANIGISEHFCFLTVCQFGFLSVVTVYWILTGCVSRLEATSALWSARILATEFEISILYFDKRNEKKYKISWSVVGTETANIDSWSRDCKHWQFVKRLKTQQWQLVQMLQTLTVGTRSANADSWYRDCKPWQLVYAGTENGYQYIECWEYSCCCCCCCSYVTSLPPHTTSWWGHLMSDFFTDPNQWGHMPPATCHLLTTTCQLPTATFHLLTATCQLPEIFSGKTFAKIFFARIF